jgi:hypothetical protein
VKFPLEAPQLGVDTALPPLPRPLDLVPSQPSLRRPRAAIFLSTIRALAPPRRIQHPSSLGGAEQSRDRAVVRQERGAAGTESGGERRGEEGSPL